MHKVSPSLARTATTFPKKVNPIDSDGKKSFQFYLSQSYERGGKRA